MDQSDGAATVTEADRIPTRPPPPNQVTEQPTDSAAPVRRRRPPPARAAPKRAVSMLVTSQEYADSGLQKSTTSLRSPPSRPPPPAALREEETESESRQPPARPPRPMSIATASSLGGTYLEPTLTTSRYTADNLPPPPPRRAPSNEIVTVLEEEEPGLEVDEEDDVANAPLTSRYTAETLPPPPPRSTRGVAPPPPPDKSDGRGVAPPPPALEANPEPEFVLEVETSVYTTRAKSIPMDPEVPLVVRKCIEYLCQPFALSEEGLFRVSGSKSEIQRLNTRLLKTGQVDLNQVNEAAVVCGFLKMHLGKGRVPPAPTRYGNMLVKALKEPLEQRVEAVREVVSQIPHPNNNCFSAVVRLLCKVWSTPGNMMKPSNLGTSLGLSVFPYLAPRNAGQILQFCMEHADTIFPPV